MVKSSSSRRSTDGRDSFGGRPSSSADYRQFVRGYAVTSYGSQGKTVDHVLFSDSAFALRRTRSNGTSRSLAAERASKFSRPTSSNSARDSAQRRARARARSSPAPRQTPRRPAANPSFASTWTRIRAADLRQRNALLEQSRSSTRPEND